MTSILAAIDRAFNRMDKIIEEYLFAIWAAFGCYTVLFLSFFPDLLGVSLEKLPLTSASFWYGPTIAAISWSSTGIIGAYLIRLVVRIAQGRWKGDVFQAATGICMIYVISRSAIMFLPLCL